MPQTVTPVDPGLPTVRAVPVAPDLLRPMADPVAELDRQVAVQIRLGAAALTGLSPEQLRDAVAPLRRMLPDVVGRASGATDPADHVPFALVLDVDPNDAVPAMWRGTRPGVSVISRAEAAAYQGVQGLEVPGGTAYLLVDIDTGSEFRGVCPEDALVTVRGRGRTPLTMAEGIALATVRPDMLRPNRCFSLMGSRDGRQRVPAIWISERRAKLGWCWDRNPHSWLGAASAAARVAAGSSRYWASARCRRTCSSSVQDGPLRSTVPQEHSSHTVPSGSRCSGT